VATPRPIDEHYHSERKLRDGTRVRLRLLTATDRDALAAGFQKLSPESRYRRFFSAMPRLPESLLTYLTSTDNVDHVAVVAELIDGGGRAGDGIGVARFVRLKDAHDRAEAAVAVVDHMHGRGVGSMLLGVLARAARERGIAKFTGVVQADNERTKSLVHALSSEAEGRFVDGVITYEVDVPPPFLDEHRDSALYRLLRLAAKELSVVFGVASGEVKER
jgi:GNAT superfamily N-acetyltransferase